MNDESMKCKDILNGKACTFKDRSDILSFIEKNKLVSREVNSLNGSRLVLSDSKGTWKATVMKRDDVPGAYLLIKEND
jgi:hypothetical protein